MKVAHLTTVDSTLWYLLRPQLLAVVAAGDEAVGISAPGPWVEAIERDGVRHVTLPTSTRGRSLRADVRAAMDLWRVLRAERFDVLHTHNPKPGVYGRVAGRLAGVPVVVNTNHGLHFGSGGRTRRIAVLTLEGIAARFSDVELVQNPEDLELLTRWRLYSPRRTSLLGNGVDLRRFRPADGAAERAAARAALGADDGQIVVGCVGRLVAEKGHLDLIEAARALDDRYRVVVIGPPDPDKSDALTPAQLTAGWLRGRPVPRPARRRRPALSGHGRVRPPFVPRGVPAGGDGGRGVRPADRRDRHPRLPSGGRRRRDRSARPRPVARPARRGHPRAR